jgi:hypothetical protein
MPVGLTIISSLPNCRKKFSLPVSFLRNIQRRVTRPENLSPI